MRLYEIAETYRAAMDDLLSADDIPADAVADTLDTLAGEFMAKARAVALYIRERRIEAQAMHQEAARIRRRADVMECAALRLTEYLDRQMLVVGIERIDAGPVRVSRRKNPPRVEITDQARVPPNLLVQPAPEPPQVDKRAALALLRETDGAADWGRIVQDTRLVIGD